MQANLAITYENLGRLEESLRLKRDVYTGFSRLFGEEHANTLREANNYAASLNELKRFEEAKTVFRKVLPVARRVLGESNQITLTMRKIHAETLYMDSAATLNDLREAAATLEETTRTTRRVLGNANPRVWLFEESLERARAALRARERPSAST